MLVPTNLFSAFSFDPLQQIMTYTAEKKNLISLPDAPEQKRIALEYLNSFRGVVAEEVDNHA